jgi:Raf kinase inhibitor-like YbhB/YbcL family protein
MQIEIESIDGRGCIPHRHTRDGSNLSPRIRFWNPPPETKALALIVHDPDAPDGHFVHWLIWNIPASRLALEEGVEHGGAKADGTRQGDNDFGERGWSGPEPPAGEDRRYVFSGYALKEPVPARDGADQKELLDAMKGHVLATASATAHYLR